MKRNETLYRKLLKVDKDAARNYSALFGCSNEFQIRINLLNHTEFLDEAFFWDETLQGHDYWNEISDKLKNMNTSFSDMDSLMTLLDSFGVSYVKGEIRSDIHEEDNIDYIYLNNENSNVFGSCCAEFAFTPDGKFVEIRLENE